MLALFENCGVKVVGHKTNNGMNTVTQQISTADLAEGLYRMVIISEDGRMHNTSFIVQHK